MKIRNRIKYVAVYLIGLTKVLATQFPMLFDVPEESHLTHFGLLIRTSDKAIVSGVEHLASNLFFLNEYTLIDYRYEDLSRSRKVVKASFLDEEFQKIDFSIYSNRSRSGKDGLTLVLLDAEGREIDADTEPVFFEIQNYTGKKFRYAAGKQPGYAYGEWIQVTMPDGRELGLDEIGIEVIRTVDTGYVPVEWWQMNRGENDFQPMISNEKGTDRIRQIKTSQYLVDVLQVSDSRLDVRVYQNGDLLPGKKDGVYQIKKNIIPQQQFRISKEKPEINEKDGHLYANLLKSLTFEKGELLEKSIWKYSTQTNEYKWNMKGIADKSLSSYAHYYIDPQTGFRIYERKRNSLVSQDSLVVKERFLERQNKWESIYRRWEKGGEIHFWKNDYFPEDKHGGQLKAAVFLDKSWCFHTYKNEKLYMHFKPVELLEDGSMVEPDLLTQDPFTRNPYKDYCIHYADKMWVPSEPPDRVEEALSFPVIRVEYFNIEREGAERERYEKFPERIEHIRNHVRQITEWYDFKYLENGGEIRIHEVGYGPEAVKGSPHNEWILREYSNQDLWSQMDSQVKEVNSRGDTTLWDRKMGDWDPAAEVFTENEKGIYQRVIITKGVKNDDKWMNGAERSTKVSLKYSRVKQFSEVFQKDGTWKVQKIFRQNEPDLLKGQFRL